MSKIFQIHRRAPMNLALVACVVAVALSGCTSGGGSQANGPTAVSGCVGDSCSGITLGEGQGAISGLVIDDRYRPISEARVLALPIGLEASTNENGEFGFVGLEPGTYTLKVSKEKHEAAPKRVDVAAGQFAEAVIEARRTVSDNSSLVAREFSVFIPCAFDVIADGFSHSCATDFSGENLRSSFDSDYSGINQVTYMVTELQTNQDDRYEIQIRGACRYAVSQFAGDYTRIVMPVGEVSPQSAEASYGPNCAWENDGGFDTLMWADSQGREELQGAGVPVCCGLGAHFGIRGQFVQSVFIGPPTVDVETYAVLA